MLRGRSATPSSSTGGSPKSIRALQLRLDAVCLGRCCCALENAGRGQRQGRGRRPPQLAQLQDSARGRAGAGGQRAKCMAACQAQRQACSIASRRAATAEPLAGPHRSSSTAAGRQARAACAPAAPLDVWPPPPPCRGRCRCRHRRRARRQTAPAWGWAHAGPTCAHDSRATAVLGGRKREGGADGRRSKDLAGRDTAAALERRLLLLQARREAA